MQEAPEPTKILLCYKKNNASVKTHLERQPRRGRLHQLRPLHLRLVHRRAGDRHHCPRRCRTNASTSRTSSSNTTSRVVMQEGRVRRGVVQVSLALGWTRPMLQKKKKKKGRCRVRICRGWGGEGEVGTY